MPSSKKRSHSGCWTCRRRHRKCDGGRPNCRVCVERNIPCEGYQVRLRWGTGIASRGRFTGAEKPLPSNASGQKESQNTESRDSRPDTYSPVDEPLLQLPSVINDARDGTIEEQILFQNCSFFLPLPSKLPLLVGFLTVMGNVDLITCPI